MPKFLADLIELLRFRFQPLSHYVYPAWQPIALLALAATLGGASSGEIQAGVPGKIAFFFVLTLTETALLSIWLMMWWKLILRRPFSGSVFPLLALCTGPQFFVPLVSFLPPVAAAVLMLAMASYSLILMMSAIAAALGERRRTVLLAMIAYLPVATVLSQLTQQLMVGWGWIVLPAIQTTSGS